MKTNEHKDPNKVQGVGKKSMNQQTGGILYLPFESNEVGFVSLAECFVGFWF